MEYLWALYVITAFANIDETKYTRIATFETREHCEMFKEEFLKTYSPFQENEEVWCLKVDHD